MMRKVAVIITLAAVLVQLIAPSSATTSADVKRVVHEAFDAAKSLLEAGTADIRSAAQLVVDEGKSLLNLGSGTHQSALQELKTLANVRTVDITDCLANTESTLVGLPGSYISKVEECGVGKIEDAKNLVVSTLERLKYFYDEAAALAEAEVDCWLMCPNYPIQMLEEMFLTRPATVGKIAKDAVALVRDVRGGLGECVRGMVADFHCDGEAIVNGIETCLYSKVNPNGPSALMNQLFKLAGKAEETE